MTRFPKYELPGNVDEVVSTLRAELDARGLHTGSYTTGFKRDIYIGGRERPDVLFEFKQNLDHAIDSMYQGHWEPSMPRRVAVVPAPAGDGTIENRLEQAGILTLFYQFKGRAFVFPGLDELLKRLEP